MRLGLVLILATAILRPGDSFAGSDTNLAERARLIFEEAQTRFQTDTNDNEAAWMFARATFDLAEFSTNDTQRADLALKGIAVSQQLLDRAPDMVQAHYYLGMNHGQLARTRALGALRLVDRMVTEFATAKKLDEHFDYAGPDRNLGLLFLEAPTIVSVGNRSKARKHLQRALELEPGYPENHLNLIEAYLKWNDRSNALQEFKKVEKLWDEAREQYAGDAWAFSWTDWDKRFKKIKAKLDSPRE